MAITRDSDMHKRRFSRNMGLGVVLIGFVARVFGLTVVKVSRQDANGNPPSAEAKP